MHRLPLHPITKNEKRITRLIIVKLTSYLKQSNEERKRTFGNETNYVYATEHLPIENFNNKKRNFFRLTKKRNKTKKELSRELKKQNIVCTLTM